MATAGPPAGDETRALAWPLLVPRARLHRADPGGAADRPDESSFTISDADSAVEALAGEDTTLGVIPDEPVAATGEPIRLGMINQDTGAVGAFPELTRAARAAVDFVNAELGGVDGRPLELITCDTGFSPEGSTAAPSASSARAWSPSPGGIDVWGTSIPVLESNEIPYIGGIPVSDAELHSPISFLFSGGSPGAFAAFAAYAVEELGAESIALMYGDFGSIKEAAERYGAGVAESLGLDPEDITLRAVPRHRGRPRSPTSTRRRRPSPTPSSPEPPTPPASR